MYAKVSYIEFLPDCEEEALTFIKNRMFPSASVQHGFKDAFILHNTAQPEKYTLICLWESLEAMLASAPPPSLLPEQQHFDTLISSFTQHIDAFLFQFSNP